MRDWLAAAIACACVGGCGTMMADVAIAPVLPLPTEFRTEVMTARPGDLIFQQDVRVIEAARLEGPVSGFVVGDLLPERAELAVGERLYRVVLQSNGQRPAYCAFSTTHNVIEEDARLCLTDADGDGRFEQAWELTEPIDAVTIGGGDLRGTGPPLDPPTPYTPIDVADLPTMRLGIKFRCGSRCWFNVVEARENGQTRDLGFVNFDIRRERNPQIVDVLGARIEVLSNSNESLEYRVVRPFSTEEPIGIIRHAPQVTYIYY